MPRASGNFAGMRSSVSPSPSPCFSAYSVPNFQSVAPFAGDELLDNNPRISKFESHFRFQLILAHTPFLIGNGFFWLLLVPDILPFLTIALFHCLLSEFNLVKIDGFPLLD